VRDSHPRASCA
jgi:hypothetical protein